MANLPAPSSSMQVFPKAQFLDPSYSSFFIDDITLDISSTSILYADDVTLMSFIKSKEERIPAAASLNQDLCNIEKWATSWNVLFGAAKCKTVTISNQRAMIYKAIIRSKMEYASSAWFGATPTSLSQLDAVQRRAIRIIDLPEDDLISHQIQPLGTRREVGALTLFHRMYYGEAPELLCQLLPEHLQLDPRLRRSVRSHDLAVQIPRSNLVSHKRSFVPSAARIWNSLPEYKPSLEKRACFKKEVNRYLGDN